MTPCSINVATSEVK